jgi:hypothetical protein
MNPNELLDNLEQLGVKFMSILNRGSGKNVPNFKSMTSKDLELMSNQIMNFFNDLVMSENNIPIIVKTNIDLRIWNLLTERVTRILRIKLSREHLGKNPQLVLQNLYSILMEDLRNSFELFRNVYVIVSDYLVENMNILISNLLNFMGDLKKLKMLLNKHFKEFKDDINLEGDLKKDSNECLKFYQYAINNNPFNPRIYSNLGFVHREFLGDYLHSSYWFIRALSCSDNQTQKIKDNLEKDFNNIRMEFLKHEYEVTNSPTMLRNDLDYLHWIYYRIQGILYMNIDIDLLENLEKNLLLIVEKMLVYYNAIPDNLRFSFEVNGQLEQFVILAIFNFHHSLNNLADYANQPERIIISYTNGLLNWQIYNNNILKDLNTGNIKSSFKSSVSFIRELTRTILNNSNETNVPFVEKYLVIIFYWLSINYDIYTLLIENDMKETLCYIAFVLSKELEQNLYKDVLIVKMNRGILPVETTFNGFIPLKRFFELNDKKEVLKVDDIKEINCFTKISLLHFLLTFNLKPKYSEVIHSRFYPRSIIKETNINDLEVNPQQVLKDKLLGNRMPIQLNVKKIKPLILLDASNIAMRHGDKTFSTKGIMIVMDYFVRNGHRVLAFLPEYLFRESITSSKKRVVPDDIEYLKKLHSEGLIVQTPSQDYDDSYCIQYCRQNNAFIVTNDLFRDYLEKFTDPTKKKAENLWIIEKRISFTFLKDEFLPNPDCAFFKEFSLDEYSKVNK